MFRKFIAVTAAVLTATSPLLAAAATTVVYPGDMDGWGFLQETATGSGALVAGPGTPVMGTGSANLVVDSTGGEIIGAAKFLGTRLDDITALQYSTYRASGDAALAVALQLNVDADLTDGNTAWQGRLVYEPYHTQTVTTGAWQTWNALNDAAGTGTGNWWFSNGTLATDSGCTMANPCTWAEVLAEYPNAGIHATLGAVVLKAGGSWTGGFNGNVDALTVGVNSVNTTFDFEAVAAPLAGSLAAEDFGVVNYDTGLGMLKGYTAGFGVSDATLAGATSVVVKLYSGPSESDLLQTNTAIISKFNADVTGTQFSSPFDVSGTFDYEEDGYWDNDRAAEYGQTEAATRVVATVTLANGKVVTATNTNLTGDPETIFPEDTTPPGDDVNEPTNKDECKKGGWEDLTDADGNPFRNQGQCVSYFNKNS